MRTRAQTAAAEHRVREREDEADARRIAARAKVVAQICGWCTSCGEHVDIAAKKLHDPWCPDAPEEHRRPRS